MAGQGDRPFWETVPLEAMSDAQWESLCDGCGRCCLQKLEDEDTGEIWYTRIACRLLDRRSGACGDYVNRFDRVPDCLAVRPLSAQKLSWLPASCAYRRLADGLPLENWHPLISGDPDSVRRAGISVAGRCISEDRVPIAEYSTHVIHWLDEVAS